MSAEQVVAHNRRICLWSSFLSSAFLANSFISLYYIGLGLSQTQIYVLQTILSIVVVCCDIPFGNLADRIGVRKVMVIGSVIMVSQCVYIIFCSNFWQLVPALIGTGLYMAALSNTSNAAMTLSLGMLEDTEELDRDELYRQFLSANTRMRFSGLIFASLGGGLLAWTTSMAWTMRLQPVLWLLCLVCAWRLVEPTVAGAAALDRRFDKGQLAKVLRIMLLERPEIRYSLAVRSVMYATELLALWMVQPRLLQAGLPLWSAGLVSAALHLSIAISAGWGRRHRASAALRYWILPIMVAAVGYTWSGIRPGFDGFAIMMVALAIGTTLSQRMFDAFLKEALPDNGVMRNTELAVGTTVPAVLFAVLAPCFGLLIDRTSLGTAYIVLAVGCGTVGGGSLLLFARALRRVGL